MEAVAVFPRRVLTVGAGVIGTVYAGRLAARGVDVTVLARGDRLRQLEAEGAVIVRAPGNDSVRARVRAVEQVSEGSFDLAIVAVRREQALVAASALARMESRIVMFFGNFAGMQQALAQVLGGERTVFGFPG